MGFVEILLIGAGLSMDAFAVAVGKGLSMKRLDMGQALVIALFFGGFQALMPAVGWMLGAQFADVVDAFSGWIAFGLLAFIGGKMIWDVLHEDSPASDEGQTDDEARTEDDKPGLDTTHASPDGPDMQGKASHLGASLSAGMDADKMEAAHDGANPALDLRELFLLAVATSIDALAMGVSFAFLHVNIASAVAVIGATTFALSLMGVAIGHQFGTRWEKASAIAGGVVLILIGVKTLLG